jgi:hypothetical protein
MVLRMRGLTVFTDNDSSAGISCRDRFVGEHASVPDDEAVVSALVPDRGDGFGALEGHAIRVTVLVAGDEHR